MERFRRRTIYAAGVAACLPIATAAAQTGRDSVRADSAAQRLKAVTVTESRSVGVVGGASAVVVRTDALRSSPAPLLEQALRESPFIHVRQNSRGEMELSVRGSDSRQAAVLLDGVPISLGWDHRTDPSLIPVTGTQNIVIVRGLGSLLNGPNTLGGTIEVSHDNGVGQTNGGQMWAGAGVDENAAFVATLGGGRRLADVMGGALSLRGGFAHRDRDGVTLPSGAVDPTASDGLRTNSDLTETDGFASLRWNNTAGRSLGITVSGFNAERGDPPEEHTSEPRYWRYPYHTRAVAAFSASTGSVTTPFGFGSLDIGAGYNSGRMKIDSYTDRTYQTVEAEELGDERTMTGRAILTHSLPGSATIKAAFTTANIGYTETLSPAAGVDYRQKMWSAGTEVEVPFGNTAIAGGVVYDKTTTPETGGRMPGQEPFDNIGWRAGLSHTVSPAVRLHASASQRSRFPALRELYSGALNRFTPNPNLKPETLLGLEAGVTMNGAVGSIPGATLQVTGFRNNLDDAVIRITLANPTRFMRVNRDRIESTGAEILGGLVFGDNADRAVSLSGDALVQKIKIFDQTANDAQRHAENNPEMRGTLELGVPLPLRLRGFANARYTGTQYCLNSDTQGETKLAGQTETDVAVERHFAIPGARLFRSLRALVSLDNVGNRTVFDSCGLPQPGRTIRVMFTVR